MIATLNNLLLPLLSIIVITIGSIFSFHAGSTTCGNGIPNIARYIAVLGTILLIVVGVIRYFLSQRRDRRLITHPILFSIILVVVVFLIENLSGCF
jgi:cell division protein FtsW (lipid II flippase)